MTYDDFLAEWRNDSDSIRCFTSGSTGAPQPILLPKREVLASARRTVDFFNLGKDSFLYSCVSPDFIGGKMVAVRAFSIDPAAPRFGYENPSNRPLAGYDGPLIDLLSVVPSQMEWIVDNLADVPSLGAILVGGSFIPDSLRRKIAASRLNAWETYGMTETASHVALRKIEWPQSPFSPLPGIKISDADGCLRIDIEGWKQVITHDLVRIDGEGRFEIYGRSDNVIITGAKKVFPEEVEALLEGVFPFDLAISWEPDEKWGQKVVMIADCNPAGEWSEQRIITACKGILPPHQVPKGVVYGRVPRTPNGKIRRKR